MRVAGASDEALDAVDHVKVAVAHRGGAHAARIGARIGLGLREAGLLLAAQRRQQILFLHLAFEREQDMADGRTGNAAAAARRQRDRARQLRLDDRFRQRGETGAAVFLRNIHHPEAEIFRAFGKTLVIFGLELLAALGRGLPLDRDHFGIDETPQCVLEDAQFLGKLEIH